MGAGWGRREASITLLAFRGYLAFPVIEKGGINIMQCLYLELQKGPFYGPK
jgi:hypothetical protein